VAGLSPDFSRSAGQATFPERILLDVR
jgi:hypothetical protein